MDLGLDEASDERGQRDARGARESLAFHTKRVGQIEVHGQSSLGVVLVHVCAYAQALRTRRQAISNGSRNALDRAAIRVANT